MKCFRRTQARLYEWPAATGPGPRRLIKKIIHFSFSLTEAFPWASAVCTENLIRIECAIESSFRKRQEGKLVSPFTGATIEALSIRANWLRNARPGSVATIIGIDAAGRTLVDVDGVSLTYGVEGLHRTSLPATRTEKRFTAGG